MRIAICGGTGFVGRHLAKALIGADHEVVLIARGKSVRRVNSRPGVTFIRADIADDVDALIAAFRGCDAVINAAGIEHAKGEQTFDRVHRVGAVNVAAAAASAQVGHLIQISALGMDADPRYPLSKSKWAAEQAIKLGFANYTIIRSGVLFGIGDHFFTPLSRSVRLGRVVAPIIGNGDGVHQPLAVTDLAECVIVALERGPERRTIEVGGPEHLSVNDIVDAIKTAVGIRRHNVHIPIPAAMPMAFLQEKLMARPAITRDQIRTLGRHRVTRRDSVSTGFGFSPLRFGDAAAYLDDY